MSLTTLIIALSILALVFFYRKRIALFINKRLGTQIQSEWIVYVLSVLFVLVIVLGMMLDTKSSGLADGFKAIKPTNSDRPHRYFDINTDN